MIAINQPHTDHLAMPKGRYYTENGKLTKLAPEHLARRDAAPVVKRPRSPNGSSAFEKGFSVVGTSKLGYSPRAGRSKRKA
jgi:hypothetical protein